MTNFATRMKRAASNLGVALGAFGAVALGAGSAFAQQATPWQLGMQDAATDVMSDIRWFNDFTLWIVTVITLFVLGLLVWVILKFNSKANPVPSKVAHNTLIEVVWTVAPVLILLVIAIPSFRLLFKELNMPKADMTVKVIGNQWYWTYAYTDIEGFKFDSYMLADDKITDKQKQPRLLAVDYPMVVPVGKVVRIQTTAADVIHSFAVPSFGVRMDAIPGRLNETWFKAEKTGRYYGECSELCGTNHAYMPIAVYVVTQDVYDAWVKVAPKDMDSADKALAAAVDLQEAGSLKLAAR